MQRPEINSLQRRMIEKDKEILMKSVIHDEDFKFYENFNYFKRQFESYNHFKQIFEENGFDYELLKAALVRKHEKIANFLINNCYCRVRNPNKINLEETPLHLSIKLKDLSIVSAILNKGPSIYDKNLKGETPLYAAFKDKYYDAVSLVLDYITNCNLKFNPDNKDDVHHFHIACIRRHMSSVILYSSLGFDVNSHLSIDSAEYSGLSPLLYLFKKKFNCCKIFEFVQVFINSGVDLNSYVPLHFENFARFTLLHFAVFNFSVEIVELLLENGADPNLPNSRGETPLHLACKNTKNMESNKIIEILLNYRANPVATDISGNTPVHLVFWRAMDKPQNELHILDKLVSKQPLKDNFIANDGLSIFHILCSRNEPNRVNEFLDSGVTIDSCILAHGEFRGFTALHFAIYFNQKAVVEVLLMRNASVNIKTHNLLTPLHLACAITPFKFYEVYEEHKKRDNAVNLDWIANRASQLNIIKLFLLNGADIEAKDKSGFTPLFEACKVNMSTVSLFPVSLKNIAMDEIHARLVEIINILLSYKANIHWKISDKRSVIHIISGNLPKISDELMDCLVTAGADIHAVDQYGLSPLHYAADRSKENLVKTFLKYKADINVKCREHKTPLQWAISRFRKRYNIYQDENNLNKSLKNCITILLENGSDINLRTEDGRLMLHDAVLCSSPFVIETLLNYGADINMVDLSVFSVKCPFSRISDWMHVLKVIFIHVQKLLALGLHVNHKLQKFCIDLHESCKTGSILCMDIEIFNNALGECISELNRMKIKKIDNYTSLYNILLKDIHELSKYVNNETFTNILESRNLGEEFPLYSYLLKLQYKKGLLRRDALEFAKESLIFAINSNLPLPDLCYDLIIKNLTNEDILSLKAAVGINNKSAKKRQSQESLLILLRKRFKIEKKM